jgi:glutamate transport system permease protein
MDSLTEYFQSYLTALETYNVAGALWVNIQLTFWAPCALWYSAPSWR